MGQARDYTYMYGLFVSLVSSSKLMIWNDREAGKKEKEIPAD